MIPRLVAHRGYMEKYPENSLTAFEMALRSGACFFELDLQMTADKQLVVLHDDNLMRTAGRADSVFDLTLDDLTNISVHEPARLGDRFFPTPIPRLTQVVELLQHYPAATAFVEIKDESLERWGLDFVMETLQQVLKSCVSQCVIIGYSFEALQIVKSRGLYRAGWVLTQFDEEHKRKAELLMPDYLICNYKKIPAQYDFLEQPWQDCGTWMLYDITDPEQSLQWAQRGIALIETRDVGAMLEHPQLKQAACQHEL